MADDPAERLDQQGGIVARTFVAQEGVLGFELDSFIAGADLLQPSANTPPGLKGDVRILTMRAA
jgi:hypothetical protein